MNATSGNHAHATSGSRLSSTPPSLHSYPSSSSIGSAAGVNNLQQHHQSSLSSSTLTNNSHNHSPGVLSSSSLNLNPLALGSGHNNNSNNQITASTFKQPSSLSLQAPPPSQHATNSGDLLNLDLFSSPNSQPPLPALPQQQQQQQQSTPTNANKPYELMFDLMGNQSCVGVTGSPKPSSDLTTSSVSSSGGSGNSLTQGNLTHSVVAVTKFGVTTTSLTSSSSSTSVFVIKSLFHGSTTATLSSRRPLSWHHQTTTTTSGGPPVATQFGGKCFE